MLIVRSFLIAVAIFLGLCYAGWLALRWYYSDYGEDRGAIGIDLILGSRALDQYREEFGAYPSTADAALAACHEGRMRDSDPWGRDYEYRVSPDRGRAWLYTLGSDGDLGGSGTATDVGVYHNETDFEFLDGNLGIPD